MSTRLPNTRPIPKRPKTPRYQPFLIVLAGVCVGIFLDRSLGLTLMVWTIGLTTAWTTWLVFWRRRVDAIAYPALLLMLVTCGGMWHHMRWNLSAVENLGHYVNREALPTCVEAVVRKGPQHFEAPDPDPMRIIPIGVRTGVEVEIVRLRNGSQWQPAAGRARVTVDGHLLNVRPGDRIRIFGQVSRSGPPDNPGGVDWTRRNQSRIRAAYPDCVTRVDGGNRFLPSHWLWNLRRLGNATLRKYLDPDRVGLAAAVLLGAREELDDDQTDAFRATGTAHLLAISGLHVGILALGVFFFTRLFLLPRQYAMIVVALAAVLYTLLTDARPPAIRATILLLAICISTWVGRRTLPFNSLAVAGLIVLAMNPTDLFSVGVHLSFIAVAGLMWFAPHWFGTETETDALQQLIDETRRWPERLLWLGWRTARHMTLVSALIWLLAMPLVMSRFHIVSPAGLILNTLLWLPMAMALLSGFGLLLFGWLIPPLAKLFGACCNGSLWIIETSNELVQSIPYSHFWVPGPANWWLIGYYGGLACWAAFPVLRPPRRWCFAVLAAWTTLGLSLSCLPQHDESLRCTFLSVGHGSATVIELPSGGTILYDAGQFASPRFGTQTISQYLWSQGIVHLDAVVISHSDADHYNTLVGLLERFQIGVVYVSPLMWEEQNPAMLALHEAIERANVPLEEIHGGQFLDVDDQRVVLEVLHPPPRGVLGGDNANSVVLAIEYLGHRILLPGDLSSPGLEDVLAEQPWHCDVLSAPHHGSRSSNPPGLARWCQPKWVVISGGFHDHLDETNDAYRQIGSQVFHTAQHGALSVRIDPHFGISVEPFLDKR